jgi:hypothetical protein
MISYSSMITEITARLGNRADLAGRVDRWLNYAYFELLLNPNFDFYELDKKNETLNTTSGVNALDVVTPIPDLWAILDIRDNTNNLKLRRSHVRVFDKIQPTPGQPVRYARFGKTIEFDPVPDGTYNLRIRYRTRPNELASGTTFSGLGTEWEEPLIVMATYKGWMALKQYEDAAATKQLMDAALATRQDVPMLEDEDSETTIEPSLVFRY